MSPHREHEVGALGGVAKYSGHPGMHHCRLQGQILCLLRLMFNDSGHTGVGLRVFYVVPESASQSFAAQVLGFRP